MDALATDSNSDINVQDEPQEQQEHRGINMLDGDDTIIDLTPPKKLPILGLPSPSDSLHFVDNQNSSDRAQARWRKRMLRFLATHRDTLARLSKSSILVVKVCQNIHQLCGWTPLTMAQVLSLSTMCSKSYGLPRLWVSSMLVGAALVDAVFEMTFLGHTGFLAFHILAMKAGCAYLHCCP